MIFNIEKVSVRSVRKSTELTTIIFKEIKRASQLRSCFPYENDMREEKTFVKMMNEHNHLYAVYYGDLLCGAAWINSWEFKTARINFAAFKTTAIFHFYEIMNEAAKKLINMKTSDGEYYYDSLYGLIEESNKKILRAARLSGLKKTGFIPNYYGVGKHVAILSLTRHFTTF